MMRARPHPTAAVAAILFLALSCLVAAHDTDHFDRRVQSHFVPGNQWSHSHEVASQIPDLVSTPVQIMCFLALVTAVAAYRRSLRPLIVATALSGFTIVGVIGFKHAIARPDTGGHVAGGSFPSGHTTLIVITVGGLLLLSVPRTRWWQWVAVSPTWVGMAWCLLYGDVHWVTDVFGGILLGWALLGAVAMIPHRAGVPIRGKVPFDAAAS
jgi:PAP2 superfamily